MLRFSFRLLLTLCLVLPLAACDSDGDDDDGNGGNIGNANVTITGDLEESFNGSAVFTVETDEGEDGFALVIFDGALTTTTSGRFVAVSGVGNRPAVGTYPLSDNETLYSGGYFDGRQTSGFLGVDAESGTLTITSSSSDRLAGSISFTGPVFSGTGESGTATVQATFDADFVDANTVPTVQPFSVEER